MKIRHKTGGMSDKIDLNMTPMIDIVFQLLAFFVMSLKIVTVEGDFNIKMPVGAASPGEVTEPVQPFKVQLVADSAGNLQSIQLGNRNLGTSFESLHLSIIYMVGDPRGPGSSAAQAEVELDCDYNLKYENVVRAITAVSGVMTPDGNVVKMIEKIKFSPPRKPA